MNPAAILTLISNLAEQLYKLTEENGRLLRELEELQVKKAKPKKAKPEKQVGPEKNA
jgi:hypothetical protein